MSKSGQRLIDAANEARGVCEHCRYWTRHHPRDAGGFCDLHSHGMAMEDESCGDFTRNEPKTNKT